LAAALLPAFDGGGALPVDFDAGFGAGFCGAFLDAAWAADIPADLPVVFFAVFSLWGFAGASTLARSKRSPVMGRLVPYFPSITQSPGPILIKPVPSPHA
jgi:hypothetical protein